MTDTAKRMNAYMEAVKRMLPCKKAIGPGAGRDCLR